MSLVGCSTCGNQIATSAKVCPHCGVKRGRSVLKTIVYGVLIVWICASILGLIAVHEGAKMVGDSVENAASNAAQAVSDDVPECDSSDALLEAKNWFNDNSRFAQQGMLVVDVQGAQQVTYDAANKYRKCAGMSVTNRGERIPFVYEFKALNTGETEVQADMIPQ